MGELMVPGAELMERVVVGGDLAALSPQQRTQYYQAVCESLGLNPLTRPFEYIVLNNKLTMYARKDATDQLRDLKQISVQITGRERMGDVYIVTARAKDANGRVDESTGAVPLVKEDGTWETARSGKRYFKGNGNWIDLRGDDFANALMKAETKAKRRVTLSICGLGWSDETEVETIPNARPVVVDDAGEIDNNRAIPHETLARIEKITGDAMEEMVDDLNDLGASNGQCIFGTAEQPNKDMLAKVNAKADEMFRRVIPEISSKEIHHELHKALGVESLYDWHGADIGKAFTAIHEYATSELGK